MHSCRTILYLALVTLTAAPASFGQAADSLVVGQAAPEITITRYVSAPVGAPSTLSDLRGQWVVVDFWAAWCSFCVAGVPHANALADSLEGEPVAFVTLSSDAEQTLRSVLGPRPSRTWVAFDSTGATAARYQIGGYPQAVVIDPAGQIAAFANPSDLTPETVRALIRGERPAIPYQYFRVTGSPADIAWDETTLVDEDDPDLYAQAIIRRSYVAQTFLRWRQTPGRILGDGVSLDALVQHAYGASSFTFDNRLQPSPAKFRVSVVAPDLAHSAARAMLRDALANAFAFTARWEPRPMDVVVLRRRSGGDAADFRPADPARPAFGGMASWTGIHASGVGMDFIVESLESFAFETVIIDETGLEGSYDLDVNWTPRDEPSAVAALERAGFDVVRERRDVPVLVVEPNRSE